MLALCWHCVGVVLVLLLALCRCGVGGPLVLKWDCIGVVLVLCSSCVGVALVLCKC